MSTYSNLHSLIAVVSWWRGLQKAVIGSFVCVLYIPTVTTKTHGCDA